MPLWSSVHKKAEVIDTYPDGRPHHVKVTVKVIGIVDQEVLEFHWGPDWMVWDAKKTVQQHGQHVEYTLRREGRRQDPACDSASPWSRRRRCRSFWSTGRATRSCNAATEGLRDFVVSREGPGDS